jgi:hypothetical protein
MSDLFPIHAELRDYANRVITFNELNSRIKAKLSNKAMDRVMDKLIIGANDIRNDIVMSMRNTRVTSKTAGMGVGRLYKKPGKLKSGKPRMHRASVEGFPPAVDTGDLVRSIMVNEYITQVEVGSIITNPAYPKWLEEGTKRMKARPWLQPAVDRNVPIIKLAIKRVLQDIAREMAEE